MRKFLLMLMATASLLAGSRSFGQTRPVSGTVKAADGSPLPGVTVQRQGSKLTVATDAAGNFTIQAATGDRLVFSSVGYESATITVSAAPIAVSLSTASTTMSDVVVTAMDIRRNSRELGYSVQRVSGTDLKESQQENFLNGLQGRVAGATITPTGGQAGASASIVLRGFNSLALSNQPLFVLDGVIIDNQTIDENSNNGNGLGLASDLPNRNNDYSSRIADINPSDIETVTVLKGPEATALYGSQAASGAILITTRKGRAGKGVRVTYDDDFRFQKLTRFPETIDTYSMGTNGVADQSFTYFGPAYPAGTKLYDNQKTFFKTGFGQTHNLSADFGNRVTSFRISGSIFDQSGVVPTNKFTRGNLRISNSTKIGKYIEIIPAVSYINTVNKKPLRGQNGYLLDLYTWPSDQDISNYTDGKNNKLPLFGINDYTSQIDNPLWNVHYNDSRDKTERLLGTLGVNINPFSWLTVAGRFGYDTYKTDGYTFYNPQSYYYPQSFHGSQDNYYRKFNGYNHTINATAHKDFGKFSGRVMVGTMWQDYNTQMYAVTGTGIIDSLRRDSANTDPASRIRLSRSKDGKYNESVARQLAYFGEIGLSYNNMVFLGYTHRFESSSSLPAINRKFSYPSLSLSVIFTDLIPGLKGGILDYGKLRTSLASTAKSNSPYSNQSVFAIANSSGGGYQYDFFNNNFYLQPETQKTYEVGTELRFFKGRLNLEADYYNTKNDKQIVENFRSSYATGFVLNTLNTATTRNQGVEIVLDATPVKTSDFGWNLKVNFNKMWNKVLFLPANVPEFYIGDTWLYNNARGGLIKGGATTGITSYGYKRNNQGQLIIDPATGLPLSDEVFKLHGDRNPDFSIGFLNNLSYKNWSFSMLWDIRVGGDVFNGTDMYLTSIGRSPRTADRNTARVIPGVLQDGNENSATPTPNNVSVTPAAVSEFYSASSYPEEAFIEHDINWLRLKTITLSYTVPYTSLKRMNYIKGLSFFVTGTDLVLITNYKGADPAVNGNTPGTKGVGAFGFDYGNIATPVGLNFGLRASF